MWSVVRFVLSLIPFLSSRPLGYSLGAAFLPMNLNEVIIDCRTVSQLDGKRGVIVGSEDAFGGRFSVHGKTQMIRVNVQGYQGSMLFYPDELRGAS